MEIRIGVLHTAKEIEIEIEATADEVTKTFDDALKNNDAVVWLTDVKGRRVGVPAEQLAYVEIESDHDAKRVGFGRPS
jgi:hypothetical protein